MLRIQDVHRSAESQRRAQAWVSESLDAIKARTRTGSPFKTNPAASESLPDCGEGRSWKQNIPGTGKNIFQGTEEQLLPLTNPDGRLVLTRVPDIVLTALHVLAHLHSWRPTLIGPLYS